jgi:hypothetical protein
MVKVQMFISLSHQMMVKTSDSGWSGKTRKVVPGIKAIPITAGSQFYLSCLSMDNQLWMATTERVHF